MAAMHDELLQLIACPRCDKSPLEARDKGVYCGACKVEFPALAGIPWLFAEPDASLGEWRGRYRMAVQKLGGEVAECDRELDRKDLRSLTRRRVERYRNAVDEHRRRLMKLLEPLDAHTTTAAYETYLALRTRLPPDQGLYTYYGNVHRDWAWGKEENAASLGQVRAVVQDNATLGRTLVLGAGAGRLAYDIAAELDTDLVVAFDFNPMLLLVAQKMAAGETLKLYEFPIAPKSLEDDAVLRKLSAPAKAGDGFHLVLGDALRPPFADGSFDTVVTPWLIDIIDEDLPVLAGRINALLRDEGRWVNFGSLAFDSAAPAKRYSPDEVSAIVSEAGFSDPYVSEATIPYMCSPASRHGRQERVYTFSAFRERPVKKPARHRALPDWIVTGREAVPLSQAFRTQAVTTQIYAFMMSLIDGKRSIEDMAAVMEKQRLMPRDEAVPAIRNFLTKMYDDAQKEARSG